MAHWRERLPVLVVTSFGLGCVPGVPGTAGSLAGVAIVALIRFAAPAWSYIWLVGLALLVVCVLTIALTPWAERHWGRKDPGAFVLDEVAGVLVTAALFRVESLLILLWVFAVTRVFDILKPPPIHRLEALPHGWGVLADDVWASLYAAAVLHGIALWFPWLLGLSA